MLYLTQDPVSMIRGYLSEIINDNSWIDYMRYWCGFEPRLVDDVTMKNLQNDNFVKMMPCYPDDGSISVINDTVVVKFADVAQ